MRRAAWIAAGLLVVSAQPVWAARTGVHEAAESQEYGRKFGGMIGRGALNVVTSFMDVLVNLVNDTKAGPPLVGTLRGAAEGLGCGVLRLGSGAVDLVTFWVPGFNGFPVSDSYDNCLTGAAQSAASPGPSTGTAVSASDEPESSIQEDIAQAASPEPASAPAATPPAKRAWKK